MSLDSRPTLEHGMDFRHVVDGMDRAVIVLGLDGKVLYWNDLAKRKSLERAVDLSGKPIWDGNDWRNLREERASLIRLFRATVQSGLPQKLILKEGRRFSSQERSIVHISLSPVRNGDGELIRVIMEEWHVPVSVQMEIKVRMTESIFRSFLDQSPLPTWLIDAQGKLIAMSSSYRELFGLGLEDIGKEMIQIIPSRFVMQYTKHHEMVLNSGEHLHVVENWMGSDEIVRTYIVHKFPIRTGLDIAMIGSIAIEVTEKIRMEEAFRESHERFSLVNEATQDLIWDWDISADTVRTQGSPELIWTDEGPQVYSSSAFFSKMHPDDRLKVEMLVRSALEDGRTDRIQGVYRYLVQDGSYVTILDRARILRDEHGRSFRVVGVAMRVTEDLQRALRQVQVDGQTRSDMQDEWNMEQRLTATGVPQLEGGIRALFSKADPSSKLRLGLSIIGFDKLIREGFNTDSILQVLTRFADTVASEGLAKNISIYLWAEQSGARMRIAHDGGTEWVKEMQSWIHDSGLCCTGADGDNDGNHMMILLSFS